MAQVAPEQGEPDGDGSGRPVIRQDDSTSLHRKILGATWWGDSPWRRYAVVLGLIGPGFVIQRIAAITRFRFEQSWRLLVHISVLDWPKIAIGSFLSLWPWSLSFALVALALPATSLTLGPLYIIFKYRVNLWVETYQQLGWLVATFLPTLAWVLLAGTLDGWPLAVAWFGLVLAVLGNVARYYSDYEDHGPGRQPARNRRPTIYERIGGSCIALVLIVPAFGLLGGLMQDSSWTPIECVVRQVDGASSIQQAYLISDDTDFLWLVDVKTRDVFAIQSGTVSIVSSCQ